MRQATVYSNVVFTIQLTSWKTIGKQWKATSEEHEDVMALKAHKMQS